MKAKLVVQVRLQSHNPDGSICERTCFIDNARVRVGSIITLINSEDRRRKWQVVHRGETVDGASINTDWKVGGL